MSFQKFTKAEKSEVLSERQHRAVEDELTRLGKTSARQLSEDERKALQKSLDSEN